MSWPHTDLSPPSASSILISFVGRHLHHAKLNGSLVPEICLISFTYVCVSVSANVHSERRHPQRLEASDALELELQMVLSHPKGFWEMNWGPLGEQWELLTIESSLQPSISIFEMQIMYTLYIEQFTGSKDTDCMYKILATQ